MSHHLKKKQMKAKLMLLLAVVAVATSCNKGDVSGSRSQMTPKAKVVRSRGGDDDDKGPIIRGRVLGHTGIPVVDAQIHLYRIDPVFSKSGFTGLDGSADLQADTTGTFQYEISIDNTIVLSTEVLLMDSLVLRSDTL
jgi:hypothetical protein